MVWYLYNYSSCTLATLRLPREGLPLPRAGTRTGCPPPRTQSPTGKKQEQTLFKDLRNRQDNGNIAKDPTLKKIYGTEVKEPCKATPRREFRVGDGNYVEEKIFCPFPQTSSPHPNNSHSF